MCRFVLTFFLLTMPGLAQRTDQLTPATSAAFDRWRTAVLAGDEAGLKKLYTDAPQIQDPKKQPISLADELAFWSSQKKAGLRAVKLDIVKVDPPDKGLQFVKFQAELKEGTKTRYVVAVQGWQAQSPPKIAWQTRTELLGLKQPVHLNPNLYNKAEDAKADIRQAEQRAARERKRVLLVFGGNWCYDCHVLDMAFHSGDIEPTLDRNFLVVHVDIGEYDKNVDLAEKYQVPLKKGVPAIAVVDATDKLIYSQQAGEFQAARSMSAEPILAFLNKWKPVR
jgi:thioredoxin family protein